MLIEVAALEARIADELAVGKAQVSAAVALLDGGATVPFIARYRKDATGALDDGQLRFLAEKLQYLRELDARREVIANSIQEQGKLTQALKTALANASSKTEIEDLYLPYKPKRRTKGQIAISAGLEPLADLLFADPNQSPSAHAPAYINVDAGFADDKAVLEGAKYILMERFAEDAKLLEALRALMDARGVLVVRKNDSFTEDGSKFSDYFDFQEPLAKIPSHRLLAVLRGHKTGVLQIEVSVPLAEGATVSPCELLLRRHFGIEHQGRAGDDWLCEVAHWCWSVKLAHSIEADRVAFYKSRAEDAAIGVFAQNLKDLLLAAPAGAKVTMGLDPAYRTGVKVAVISATGEVLDHVAIYPHAPQNKWQQSLAILAQLCQKHQVALISIGNGTASRETDKLAGELLSAHPELKLTKLVVSEAGASVYSASEYGAQEFPDLDVTVRGAISIARRLQDPLAELVKIDPKAIGVGQYQHDVNQIKLAKSLDDVVEDCVNGVGVDVNTASKALLARVSGLGAATAHNIVEYRRTHGAFAERKALLDVPRLGAKAYEQAAGFLRIVHGDNILDASAVHPEAYELVGKIASDHARPVSSLIGDSQFLQNLDTAAYISQEHGALAIQDILAELAKPWRDPRGQFKTAQFQDGIEKISDLKIGMQLEGVVSNVTNFGAFVDVGVHQDGLVHISMLANKFVKDPREVVKAGDVVRVKVMEVDVKRQRIALSMRLDEKAPPSTAKVAADKSGKASQKPRRNIGTKPQGAMADALGALFNK